MAKAPHRKQLRLRYERGAASPMEGRAVRRAAELSR